MKNNSKVSTIQSIRNIRIEKVAKLKKLGIDPYPSKSRRENKCLEIKENFEKYEGKVVVLAGRLMSWREHGALVFGDLQDSSGRLQMYIREDALAKTDAKLQNIGFSDLGLLDVGDILEVEGEVTKTKRGEVSVIPKYIKILSKSIRPLPEKWSGIKDKETIFRSRYLDTIMNPDKKWRFQKTAELSFAIREFLNKKGFLEIKTPFIQPVYGGTNARAFKTYVNALNTDYYMAISHELYLKRLITAGFDNVFNLNGYFRNEGIDRTHNPEFSMIETMTAYQNYEYNMQLIEEMYEYIARKVFGKTKFNVMGEEVDFASGWDRITMMAAVKKYAGYDFDKVKDVKDAWKILDEIGFEKEKPATIGESMLCVFEEKVESQLIKPTFVTGHPVEISPLAKSLSSDNRFVERFEIFIGGMEGGDNWTELNDPVELFERFKAQVERGRGGDEEFQPMDIEFIEMMEYGMPPTTGLGPGVERLAMLFTETEYIDDVIFFPMLKPAPITANQKAIYGEEYLVDVAEVGDGVQDLTKKIVIVVDKSLENWQVVNVSSHVASVIGRKIKNFTSGGRLFSKDGKAFDFNSQYNIVTLKAGSGQIMKLYDSVAESSDIESFMFLEEMLELSDDAQMKKDVGNKQSSDIKGIGIGLFGDKELLDKFTGKFSLWR